MAKRGTPPRGLVAQRFERDGVAYVAFEWDAERDWSELTSSEREVARLLVGGASNAAIAKARGVSVRTVANQVAAILKKLGAESRFDLMARRPGAER